jgi:23S rRNA (guanine745-N1)-methyltransferase
VILDEVVRWLACPVCAEPMTRVGPALHCLQGHHHDIGRDGTLTLAAAGANLTTGDTAAMVADRAAFFDAGHYDALIAAICAADRPLLPVERPAVVVDAGAGTGHLLAAVVAPADGAVGLALDSSKPAVRCAARRSARVAGIACDLWSRWPVRPAAADVVLSVFAPRAHDEVLRVLRPGGAWIVALPSGREHLGELRDAIPMLGIPDGKADAVAASLPEGLRVRTMQRLQTSVHLTPVDITRLVRMGPNRHHLDDAALQAAVANLPEGGVVVTQSIDVVVVRAGALSA